MVHHMPNTFLGKSALLRALVRQGQTRTCSFVYSCCRPYFYARSPSSCSARRVKECTRTGMYIQCIHAPMHAGWYAQHGGAWTSVVDAGISKMGARSPCACHVPCGAHQGKPHAGVSLPHNRYIRPRSTCSGRCVWRPETPAHLVLLHGVLIQMCLHRPVYSQADMAAQMRQFSFMRFSSSPLPPPPSCT